MYNTLLVSCLTRKRRGTVPTTSQLFSYFDIIYWEHFYGLYLESLDDYSFHVSTQPPEVIVMTTQLLTTKGGVTPLKCTVIIVLLSYQLICDPSSLFLL